MLWLQPFFFLNLIHLLCHYSKSPRDMFFWISAHTLMVFPLCIHRVSDILLIFQTSSFFSALIPSWYCANKNKTTPREGDERGLNPSQLILSSQLTEGTLLVFVQLAGNSSGEGPGARVILCGAAQRNTVTASPVLVWFALCGRRAACLLSRLNVTHWLREILNSFFVLFGSFSVF